MGAKEFRNSRIQEGGYPLHSGNRHGGGLVGRTPWSARDALVPPPAPEPGGSERAWAPAPLGSADDDYLSEADTHLN